MGEEDTTILVPSGTLVPFLENPGSTGSQPGLPGRVPGTEVASGKWQPSPLLDFSTAGHTSSAAPQLPGN